MSSQSTLARPFAKAAFALAQSAGELALWSNKLSVSAALSADAGISALIHSPKVKVAERAAVLLPPAEASDSAFARFLHTLAENARLPLLPEVAREFELLRAQAEGTLKVQVTSALPIEPAQQQQLIDKLSKRFARQVSLDIVLQPDLIGGAIVNAGSVVIEGSVRGKIHRMHNELGA